MWQDILLQTSRSSGETWWPQRPWEYIRSVSACVGEDTDLGQPCSRCRRSSGSLIGRETLPASPCVVTLLLPAWSWIIFLTATLFHQYWSLPWPQDRSCTSSVTLLHSAKERARASHKRTISPRQYFLLKAVILPTALPLTQCANAFH